MNRREVVIRCLAALPVAGCGDPAPSVQARKLTRDWSRPVDHWIDARAAFFVVGSNRPGSMGPTLAAFAREADAQAFAGKHGGKVLPFDGVTPEMVALDGGVVSDERM